MKETLQSVEARLNGPASRQEFHRHYLDEAVSFRVENAISFPMMTDLSLKDTFESLMYDIRADTEATYALREVKHIDFTTQEALKVEVKLSIVDRLSIYAGQEGITIGEADKKLSYDSRPLGLILDEAEVPRVRLRDFNTPGKFYPQIGLSWNKHLGKNLNDIGYLLTQFPRLYVPSNEFRRVDTTEPKGSARTDNEPNFQYLPCEELGFELKLVYHSAGLTRLDLQVHLDEVELYIDLPGFVARYALLQRIMASKLGVKTGQLQFIIANIYRTGKKSTMYAEYFSPEVELIKTMLSVPNLKRRDLDSLYWDEITVTQTTGGTGNVTDINGSR